MLRYAFVALTANVIFYFEYRIDYWFVRHSAVCTDNDLGNYIQVSKLGQMLLIVPQILAGVIFPRSASGIERDALNKTLMIIARLFFTVFLLIAIAVILCGNTVFVWMFGTTFNKMQLPFIILIPGIFFLSVLALLSAYFSGKGNVKVNVSGALLALCFMIIADYFFVPLYGIIAAAAISTLSYAMNTVYSLMQFYRDYSVNIIDFFDGKNQIITGCFLYCAKNPNYD